MFIGALVDCFPRLAATLPGQLVRAGFENMVQLQAHPADDGTLTGTRFEVVAAEHAHGHEHRHYRDIVALIEGSTLDDTSRQTALGIFGILAEAEAGIHGKPVADIAFHEVGAWDSIADIVCASCLVSAVGAQSWSVSTLPLGRGRVKMAHGSLPVPAPATARILEGFEFHDDGIAGERITPTGAAILKQLAPSQHGGRRGKLTASGYGFGSRKLAGISNVARALVFESEAVDSWSMDEVVVLAFEVDDQTPEELAVALSQLRDLPGVLDISQTAVLGKKGRQLASIRVLARPAEERNLLRACFTETTTLGIRRELVSRAVLERHEASVTRDEARYRVKLATRPGIVTVKAEMDDIAAAPGGNAQRRQLRDALERQAKEAQDE